MGLEAIAITIEYGAHKIEGLVLKINPTGILVELEKIPYQVGNSVKVSFSLDGVNTYASDARPIKSYDNHTKKVRIETNEGSKIETKPMKLSELHFISPSENMRAAIMRHLMDLQVNLMKKS